MIDIAKEITGGNLKPTIAGIFDQLEKLCDEIDALERLRVQDAVLIETLRKTAIKCPECGKYLFGGSHHDGSDTVAGGSLKWLDDLRMEVVELRKDRARLKYLLSVSDEFDTIEEIDAAMESTREGKPR